MTDRFQKKVLDSLLDSYEKSKTFQGENQINQSFSVNIGKLFPKYQDDSEYDTFCRVNEAMEELSAEGLVFLEYKKKGVLKKVRLNPERLDACYELLERTPRRQEQEELLQLWEEFCPQEEEEESEESGRPRPERIKRQEASMGRKQAGEQEKPEERRMEEWSGEKLQPLRTYIVAQRVRIGKNQNVEYYDHDLTEYRELLLAVRAALENREEIFIRNFSIRLFHDSKRAEQLAHKLEALLYQYGEFQERASVLEECGIVHTPTYVMMKGNGILNLGGQKLDLSLLQGDLALSTESIGSLQDIVVEGERVITVENLTSFHDYPAGEDFVIYLGGFHNKVKREFLCYLYERNSQKEYRHFGDIDAGGFYILEHLKRKTGIAFRSLCMDRETLQQYREDRKPLTENDRRRLMQLREELDVRLRQGAENVEDYHEVIDYMLENDCKLEQEAVKSVFLSEGR